MCGYNNRSRFGARGPLASQAGVSLIEVSLAIVVLAFGVGGVLTVLQSSERGAGRSHRVCVAQMIASQKAEELKAAGFAALRDYISATPKPGAPGSAVYPSAGPEEMPLAGAASAGPGSVCRWRAELALTAVAEGSPPFVRIVSIVEWQGDGQTERIEHAYVYP